MRVLAFEAVWVLEKGVVERALSGREHGAGLSVVDAVWGHVGDAGMAMDGVVPSEECSAVGACVVEAAEAGGKVGAVFQGLELSLGEGVVVGDVRPAVALDDIEVDEQGGDRLGAHAGAAIGVQGQGSGYDVVAGDGFGDELLGEFRAERPSSRRQDG